MTTAARFEGSLGRLQEHFHGGQTVDLWTAVEGATKDTNVDCTAPMPWLSTLGPDNGEDGDIQIAVRANDPQLTITPQPGHWAILNSVSYRVVAVQTGKADAVYRYTLTLRGLE